VRTTAAVHATSRMFFHKKFLGPYAAKDPERSTSTSDKDYNKLIYKPQKSWQMQRLEQEPYSYMGWRWNRVATTMVTS
jgi:hypothetical protein